MVSSSSLSFTVWIMIDGVSYLSFICFAIWGSEEATTNPLRKHLSLGFFTYLLSLNYLSLWKQLQISVSALLALLNINHRYLPNVMQWPDNRRQNYHIHVQYIHTSHTWRSARGILILQKFEILNFAWCQIMPIGSLISELFCFCSRTFRSHEGNFFDFNGNFNGKMAKNH